MNTNIILKKRKQRNICGGEMKSPVDCSDNEMMVREGLRPSLFELNKMHFYKTRSEKEEVNRLKRIQSLFSGKPVFNDIYHKPIGRLIVHLKNDQHLKDFHTTFNYECKEHEVKEILSVFHDKQIVTSVKFNGREINHG